jgi:hypothetical protein
MATHVVSNLHEIPINLPVMVFVDELHFFPDSI